MRQTTERGATHTQVLVVEDDEGVRQMMIMTLEDEQWPVIEAKDGAEALAMLRSSPSRLVALVDVMMPGMSGEDMLEIVKADRELRRRHAYVVVSANTTKFSSRLQDLIRDLDVPVMSKPFRLQDLLDTVQRQADRLNAQETLSS
jgi:CheY-like chemotaxis protein